MRVLHVCLLSQGLFEIYRTGRGRSLRYDILSASVTLRLLLGSLASAHSLRSRQFAIGAAAGLLGERHNADRDQQLGSGVKLKFTVITTIAKKHLSNQINALQHHAGFFVHCILPDCRKCWKCWKTNYKSSKLAPSGEGC